MNDRSLGIDITLDLISISISISISVQDDVSCDSSSTLGRNKDKYISDITITTIGMKTYPVPIKISVSITSSANGIISLPFDCSNDSSSIKLATLTTIKTMIRLSWTGLGRLFRELSLILLVWGLVMLVPVDGADETKHSSM